MPIGPVCLFQRFYHTSPYWIQNPPPF